MKSKKLETVVFLAIVTSIILPGYGKDEDSQSGPPPVLISESGVPSFGEEDIDYSLYVEAFNIEVLKKEFPITSGMTLAEMRRTAKQHAIDISKESLQNGAGWIYGRMLKVSKSDYLSYRATIHVDMVIEENTIKSVWVMPAMQRMLSFVYYRLSGEGPHIGPEMWGQYLGNKKKVQIDTRKRQIDDTLLLSLMEIDKFIKVYPIRAGMSLDEIKAMEQKGQLPFAKEGLSDGNGWITYWTNQGGLYFCDLIIENHKVKSVWVMAGNQEWSVLVYYRLSGKGKRIGAGRWKKIGGDSVFFLVKELKDASLEPEHVKILEKTSESKVITPVLIELTKSSYEKIRVWAIRALSETASADISAPVLIELLNDKSREVRSAVASALGQMGDKAGPACENIAQLAFTDNFFMNRQIPMILGAMGENAKPAIPILLKALQSEKTEVRENSLIAFGCMGVQAETVIPQIIKATKDPSDDVRIKAIEVLSRRMGLETKEIVELLASFLSDGNKNVRQAAASGLGRMKRSPIEALPEMMQALQVSYADESDEKQWICNALGNIGSEAKEAVPFIIPYVSQGRDYLQIAAVKALGKMGKDAKEALPILKETLSNLNVKYEWRREVFKEAIDKISKDIE